MKELLARLFARPALAAELVTASLFANVLALASPLFVIQVLNHYVAHGVDSTLATLTAGVVIAIVLEFGFRQVRLRLGAAVNSRKDEDLGVGAFAVLTGAKASAIDMMPAGLRREVISGTDAVETAYSPSNIAALLFVGVLYLINPLLALIAGGFLAAVFIAALVSLMTLAPADPGADRRLGPAQRPGQLGDDGLGHGARLQRRSLHAPPISPLTKSALDTSGLV